MILILIIIMEFQPHSETMRPMIAGWVSLDSPLINTDTEFFLSRYYVTRYCINAFRIKMEWSNVELIWCHNFAGYFIVQLCHHIGGYRVNPMSINELLGVYSIRNDIPTPAIKLETLSDRRPPLPNTGLLPPVVVNGEFHHPFSASWAK